MGSVPAETFSMEVQRHLDIEDTSQTEKAQWILNAPSPPPIWKEIILSVKETILPHGNMLFSASQKQNRSRHVFSCLHGIFPILSWGRNYRASKFKSDLLAGLTLASLSIPQSIGYANLAKLEPQYGLYTSVVPPLIYSVMGSSREIAIGPVAVVSLLLASMIQKVEDPVADPIAYRKLVLTVTFFAGIFQAGFGLLRLGFLVDFLSHCCFILEAVSKSIHHQITNREKWYPLNFVLGCSFLIFLLTTRFIGRRNKKLFWLPAIAPLISVILSTLIVYFTKADKHGVNIVKHVKRGLNPSSAHQLELHGPHVGQAAKIGLISAVVALTEAIAVGRSFARSLTSCYVATGSFSRTAVNFSAGCETAVSNIVMAITVFLCLELFTRLLYFTPIAILASIILSALPGLIDINEAYYIWKVDKLDFIACIGAFLGVLFASVEIGLLVAVTISFAKVLLQSIRPSIEVLGKLPRTDAFCEISQYPMAIRTPGTLVIRISSGSLCFANANFIRERIMKWVTEEEADFRETAKGKMQAVILDMTNVMNVDTSGVLALEELHKKMVSHGMELAMVNPRWQVIHKLKLAEFVDKIGRGWVFLTVGEAVEACLSSKVSIP
ncbi:putative Sulfate transporter [Quillaja saponaria]|uniref:Sulfate transporter n=1 Tax=Quillaja saponaria TaxID=32244 RepID=A0AAD7PSC5_QUISA|nr:putative Sulfate transporter [Quillaja saponaria]KAJ7965668.1 putative Sulfate transporter [Quillaja saponaria]